jgi:DNA-binding protein HU-beta
MNKKELINAVAGLIGEKQSAIEAVNAVLDTIQVAVAKGDKVSIPGFGSFEQVHKPAYVARNPSTGEPVEVAESWAPKFKAGSEFKALVNEGGKTAHAAA